MSRFRGTTAREVGSFLMTIQVWAGCMLHRSKRRLDDHETGAPARPRAGKPRDGGRKRRVTKLPSGGRMYLDTSDGVPATHSRWLHLAARGTYYCTLHIRNRPGPHGADGVGLVRWPMGNPSCGFRERAAWDGTSAQVGASLQASERGSGQARVGESGSSSGEGSRG